MIKKPSHVHQCLLRASKARYEPVKIEYGTVTRDKKDIELTLTRLRGKVRTYALVAHEGRLLKKDLPIALWKKEGTAITDIIDVKVGDSGSIPVVELERGMQYLVKDLTKGTSDDWKFIGKFVWEGQQTIVLQPDR